MGHEIDREFEFYLVAHEFNIPVGKVKKWPFTKFLRHNTYLAQYYKMMGGGGGQDMKLPAGMGKHSGGAKQHSGSPLHAFHFKEMKDGS